MMEMTWADSNAQIWEVRFYGSLNQSSMEDNQCVFVLADDVEEAIDAVRAVHDESAQVTLAMRHWALSKETK